MGDAEPASAGGRPANMGGERPKTSKAPTKAERRAKAAAKAVRGGNDSKGKSGNAGGTGGTGGAGGPSGGKSARGSASSGAGHALFSHLGTERLGSRELVAKHLAQKGSAEVHPSLIAMGLQTVSDSAPLVGSNARCVAMLNCFKQLIDEYTTPAGKHISRDLASTLSPSITFLTRCRPLAFSMGNAIKWLKGQIASLPLTMNEQEAKTTLTDAIDAYVQEKVVFAHTVIADHANDKIHDGETVLTFGYSDVVEEVLKRAHDVGKRITVVVVDARPRMEGKTMLTRLAEHGVSCSYVLLNAVSYIMKQVSKVFIGAVAMLNNGTAMGRAGTAMIALTAHAYNTPVMVCCETYKFCERAQLDSICFNELGRYIRPATTCSEKGTQLTNVSRCACQPAGSPEQLVHPKGWPSSAKADAGSSTPLDLRTDSSLSVSIYEYLIT